ncbi:MAG TPA: AI-2E family transporter [Gemmatimonadales bacterium]|nr:AI-2E family transporter [Gemmatimonadales bacterium]
MTLFDTEKQRAAWVVAILGLLIVLALAPYASGLLGAPVLYIIMAPLHRWLLPRLKHRGLVTTLVIVVALVGIVLPFTWVLSLLVGQAQSAAQAVIDSPLLDRLDSLTIGPYAVGQELRQLGSKLVGMLGGGAISVIGKVTRISLNLVFAFFGLYYILQDPKGAWRRVRPYIPFSDENVELLRERFESVTMATVLGSGLCAVAQGILMAIAFQVSGLGNAVFWGAVTMVFSILPVLGSGLVWVPAAIVLYTTGHPAMALGMAIFGTLVVGGVDNLIRPWVYRRYAEVHPMITIVGAIAGVSYLGILGLLIGPLALMYFFELVRMYAKEYL